MNDRSESAKSIFLEAIEKHVPEQWPAFVEQSCAGNISLKANQVIDVLRQSPLKIDVVRDRDDSHGQNRRPQVEGDDLSSVREN